MANDFYSDNAASQALSGYDAAENRRTNIAVYGLIFVIMVSVGRVQEIIPGLSVLKLGKVAFGLAFILYFVSPKRSDIHVFSAPQMKYALAIFLLGLASTPFSYWPGKSFNFMVFNFFNTLVLLFLLIKIANTYADLKKLVWGIIVSISLLGITALLSGGVRASAGGSYDPNDLALVLVLFLPLFYFSMKNEQGTLRLILASASIVSIAAIMATQSRGGFIGLVTVVAGILIKERFNFIKLLLVGSTLFIAFSVLAPPGYSERISTIFNPQEDYNMTEGGGRIEIWKRGLQLMKENPLLGVGPAAFEVAEGSTHIDENTGNTGKWSTAHNSFVQIGAELGIPGLMLLVMIMVSSIRSLKRLHRELPKNSELRWLVNALEVGIYGYIINGFFLSQAYSSALFLLVGLTVVVVNQATRVCEKP